AKRAALRALIGRADVRNGIVFCNRKSEVDVVAKSLKQHGFDAAPIHGDLDQSLRMKTLAAFRSGELKLLVASDVAARGLDIPDVSHVFNYDVSHHADDYVHRIGRTGRAGKTGQTFMIVTPADDRSLDKVLKLIKMAPEELVLDGVDFSPGKEQPRRDAGRSEGAAPRARGRTRRETPAETAPETAAPVEAARPTATEPVPEADAPPARRSRSRRGSRSSGEAAAESPATATPPAPAPVPVPVPVSSDRPVQETHLRQSDRRGVGADPEAPRSNGRPFGESDVPAFLRRPVSIDG
ncbi:MAG: C-terminal helicase domain-containing protein, partial [Brevundimonas sp.]